MKNSRVLWWAFAGLLGLSSINEAFAAGHWARHHPRRAEVNHRLHHQNERINQKLIHKKMTYQEGSKLKQEDRQIRGEERAMARQHHGHITRGEQRALNSQLNGVSQDIGH